MKKVRFLYNAKAGETLITDHIADIISIYQDKGYSIIPYKLTFAEDEEEKMLGEVDASYHHILMAGGDGTVNYIVNAIKRRGLDIPLAVLPAGTANDFAKMLGMPAGILKGCRKILSGEIVNVDLGLANGEYFVNVFSCGLFTDISQKVPTVMKNNFGKIAYYFSGLGELPLFRMMDIALETDRGNYEGPSIIFFVFNGQTAGQIRLAHFSEIDDGLLDVVVIKGDNPLETMRSVFHFMKRTPKKYPAGVFHIQCNELTAYSANDEKTDIDGEAGPRFPVNISCAKGGLKVLRPVKAL